MGRRRAWATLAVAVVLLGVLVACSGGDDGGDAVDPPEPTDVEASVPEAVDDLAGLESLRASSTGPFSVHAGPDGALNGVTGGFELGDGGVEAFLAEHAGLFGLDQPGIGLVAAEGGSTLDEGTTVTRFGQTYRGVPVAGGDLVVAVEGDTVRSVVGGGLGPLAMEVRPVLTPVQAVEAAVAAVGGGAARTAPELVIVDRADLDSGAAPDHVLAWRVGVAGPGGAQRVDVAAASTEAVVLGVVGLDADARPDDLDVWNTHGAPQDEFVGDTLCSEEGDLYATEDGRESGVPFDQTSDDGWRSLLAVYDYYLAEYGLDSYDGDGDTLQLRANVVMETDGNHGFWESWCEAIHIDSDGTSQEYVAHEFGHGIFDDRTGSPEGLHYRAINESFADVLASGIEDDWIVIGRDASVPRNFRDHFSSDNGEHANSRVASHAWWLIAHGDGDSIVGLGGGRTRDLVLTTLSVIPDDITMYDLENNAVVAAVLRGYGSDDLCTVIRAWSRVMSGVSDLPGCSYADADGDGTPDRIDGCDDRQGPDTDLDGQADHCDANDDGDRWADDEDLCPTTADPSNGDQDGDGIGNACDPDRDGDGIPDAEDSCPRVPNPEQRTGAVPNSLADQDFDGIDDACDSIVDTDGDGHANGEDNCTWDWNDDQADADGDGIGDACEIDTDGDGISDLEDNCSLVADPDQANADGDPLGDACDPCPAGADQVIASQPPHDPDGPGGLPAIGGSTLVLNDQDGDGVPDGCDLGGVLQMTGIGDMRAVSPLGGLGGSGDQLFDLPRPCRDADADDDPDPAGPVTVEILVAHLPPGARAGILAGDGRVLTAPPAGDDGSFTLRIEVLPGSSLLLALTGADGPDGGGGGGVHSVTATADIRYEACDESGDDPFPPTGTVVARPAGDLPITTVPGASVSTTGPGGTVGTIGTVPPLGTVGPGATVPPLGTVGTVPPLGTVPTPGRVTTTTRPRFSTTTVPCFGIVPRPGQTTTTRAPGTPCTTTTTTRTRPTIGTVPQPTIGSG